MRSLPLLLLAGAVAVHGAFGQDPASIHKEYEPYVIPKSPTAQAFEQYGNLGANTAKGTVDIRVPIQVLEVDGLKLPIELVYNSSGVRVNDLSTAVGQNWSLVADGRISRNIIGLQDENGGYFTDRGSLNASLGWNSETDCDAKIMRFETLNRNAIDCSPDLFGYAFNGHSGSFVFFRDQGGALSAYKLSTDRVKLDKGSPSWDHISLGSFVFIAKDGQGNTYEFGGDTTYTEMSRNRSQTTSLTSPISGYIDARGRTGWLLRRITTKNGRTVEFRYRKVRINGYSYRTGEQVSYTPAYYSSSPSTSRSVTTCQYDYEVCLVDSIKTPTHIVTFTYQTDDQLQVWRTKLSSIKVLDRIRRQPLKRVNLSYVQHSGRLFLTSVAQDTTNVHLARSFSYYGASSLPAYGSLAQDFFGYYNGANGNTSLVPFLKVDPSFQDNPNGNRYVCPSTVCYGALSSIAYPTGGTTNIYYEPNLSIQGGAAVFSGGIRVRRTEDYDGASPIRSRDYLYYSLSGGAADVQSGDLSNAVKYYSAPSVAETRETTMSSSSLIGKTTPNTPAGYYYGRVLTAEGLSSPILFSYTPPCASACANAAGAYPFSPEGSTPNGWVEERYQGYAVGGRVEPMLTSRRVYGSSGQKVERTENTYGVIGAGGPIAEGTCPATYVPEVTHYSRWLCESLQYGWDQDVEHAPSRPQYLLHASYFRRSDAYLANSKKVSFPSTSDTTARVTESTGYRYNDYLLPVEVRVGTSQGANGDELVKTVSYVPEGSPRFTEGYMVGLTDTVRLSRPYYAAPTSAEVLNGIDGEAYGYDAHGNTVEVSRICVGNLDIPGHHSDETIVATNELQYDNGRVILSQKLGEPYETYLWGYSGEYPLIKAVNVPYSTLQQAASAYPPPCTVENPEDTRWRQFHQAIRNYIAQPGALITTYTWRPGVGITSETDPNGSTTYYDYDSLGRLLQVRDAKGSVLKRYEYNYAQ